MQKSQVKPYLQDKCDEIVTGRGRGIKFMSHSAMRITLVKVEINTWTCFKPDDCHNENRQKAGCIRNVLCTEAVRHVAREGPRLDCEDAEVAAANPIDDLLNLNKVDNQWHWAALHDMHVHTRSFTIITLTQDDTTTIVSNGHGLKNEVLIAYSKKVCASQQLFRYVVLSGLLCV